MNISLHLFRINWNKDFKSVQLLEIKSTKWVESLLGFCKTVNGTWITLFYITVYNTYQKKLTN